MRRKYEELLPHLATRDDLNRVIRMMLSELAVGHSFLGGGERLYEPKPIPVGLLGADYEVADGRYRFKTIYGGAYWDPSLRAPLTAPGVDVKPGDFLLAVDGKEVKADSEVYRSLRGDRRQARRAQGRPQGRRHRAHARSSSSRSPTRARCATAPGSRATSARSTSGPRAESPTSTCPTRPDRDMNTSSATSSRRPTRRRSSSTSGSTAAARWPTITSTCSAGRWSATGRPATARRSARPTRRSWAPRS